MIGGVCFVAVCTQCAFVLLEKNTVPLLRSGKFERNAALEDVFENMRGKVGHLT